MTLQETDLDLPVSVQESAGGMGWWWPAAGLGALSVAVPAQDLSSSVQLLSRVRLFATP